MNFDPSAIPLVIGVTGHRTLSDVSALAQVVLEQLQRIAQRFAHGPILLLSPLAEGADRLVAQLAIRHLGARLIVPLPMAVEEYERDFADPASLAEFRELLAQASAVFVVGRGPDEPPAPPDLHQRCLSYARAGAYITENCQVLIALWDGQPARGLGGTADVVAWELAGAPPDECLAPSSPRRYFNALELGYVVHIHTLNRRVALLPADRAATTDLLVEKIDLFNRDLQAFGVRHGEGPIQQSRSWLLGEFAEHPLVADDRGLRLIADVHAGADALAGDYKRRHAAIFNLIYGLFVVAILMFGLIDWRQNLIWLYVLIFPLLFILHTVATRRQLEDRSLDYRALAEGLRVLAFWRLSGIHRRVSDSYLSKHSGALAWIRRAIANVELAAMDGAAGTHDPSQTTDSPQGVGVVTRLWVEAQLKFFTARRRQVARANRRLVRLSASAFTLTFMVAIVYAISLWSIEHTVAGAEFFGRFLQLGMDASADDVVDAAGDMFQAIMGFLGALGVASEAIRAKKDYENQERRYTLAQDLFAKARRHLDPPDVRAQELLVALGQEALFENGEWLWTHRSLSGQMLKG